MNPPASDSESRLDISIAGEVNMDLILYGLEEAIPVDREILASNFEMTLGSSSAILAHNLAVLGRRVGFVTRYGSDVPAPTRNTVGRFSTGSSTPHRERKLLSSAARPRSCSKVEIQLPGC